MVDMEEVIIEVCSIGSNSVLKSSELKESKEVMEVSVEIEEESTLHGCRELVSEPLDAQLGECLREDTEKVPSQALPVSCA